MDFFTNVAKTLGEHEFYLRMYILDSLSDFEVTFVDYCKDIVQILDEDIQFFLFEQSYRFKHTDVGD